MPELEQKTFPKRHVAYKARISDILNANLTKDEFFSAYIKLNNINILRVNIIATIVYKYEDLSYAGVIIDDGTGKISLRSFENRNAFSSIDVGEMVLVIGKIREFNNEKYILTEILKKIDNSQWVNVRKLELNSINIVVENKVQTENNNLLSDVISASEEVYSLIKKLDDGEGASTDEVIKNTNINDAENIIKKLLEDGQIFEIRSGKVKVLE